MTDMQRYRINQHPLHTADMKQDESGFWVSYADAEAAIAAAVSDFRAAMNEGVWYQSGWEEGLDEGQRGMLAKALKLAPEIERELMRDHGCLHHNGPGSGACKACKRRVQIVLAALRALEEKP